MHPTLRLQLVQIPALGIEFDAVFAFHDFTGNIDVRQKFDFFHIFRANGKQQLVVFTAIEGTSNGVEFELQGQQMRFRVNGDGDDLPPRPI